jgi:hypothetical protein
MVILLNDSGIVPGVCAVGGAHQQPFQFNKGREIDTRRAHGHPGASNGIKHPVGNDNDRTDRPHNAQKSPRCPLRYAPNEDLAAKIGVPAVMDF